jgi:Zn-finger nucleic acid-binding protein
MWIGTIGIKRRLSLAAAAPEAVNEANQASLADLAAVVSEAHSTKALRCPECEKPMPKSRYHAMIPVIVDRCRGCDSLWLDTGEYNLLRQLFRELATSDDPEIMRLREKVGAANSQWESRSSATERAAESLGDIIDAETLLTGLIRTLMR